MQGRCTLSVKENRVYRRDASEGGGEGDVGVQSWRADLGCAALRAEAHRNYMSFSLGTGKSKTHSQGVVLRRVRPL